MGQSRSRFQMNSQLYAERELRNVSVEGFGDFLRKKRNILVLHMAENTIDEPCPLLIAQNPGSFADGHDCSCEGLYCRARGWSSQWLTYSPGLWLAFVQHLKSNDQLLRCYTESMFSLKGSSLETHLVHVYGSTASSLCSSCLRPSTWESCYSRLSKLAEKPDTSGTSSPDQYFVLECGVCGGLIEPVHHNTTNLVNNHISDMIRQDVSRADALVIIGNGTLERYPLQGIPLDLPATVPRMLIHPTPLLEASSYEPHTVELVELLQDTEPADTAGTPLGEEEFHNPADGFPKNEGTVLIARSSRTDANETKLSGEGDRLTPSVGENEGHEKGVMTLTQEQEEPEQDLWSLVHGSKGIVATSENEDTSGQDVRAGSIDVSDVDVMSLWREYSDFHGGSDALFPALNKETLSWGFRHNTEDNYRDVVLLTGESEGISLLFAHMSSEVALDNLQSQMAQCFVRLRQSALAAPEKDPNESPIRENTTSFFTRFSESVMSSKVYLQELPVDSEKMLNKESFVALLESSNKDILKNAFIPED